MTARAKSVVAILLFLLGGCSAAEPNLPPTSDVVAISDRMTGQDGEVFLRDITSMSWDDEGRRAAQIFAWLPQAAESDDPAVAERAGKTAQALAEFLADEQEVVAGAPANPALWQAFSESLIPYLGAMVGDGSGVMGFEALDGLDSQMGRTASLFAAFAARDHANLAFADAASKRAGSYEATFARSAVAEPLMADREVAGRNLMQAARLRGLVAGGAYLANPDSERPSPAAAQTELAYQVARLTARPGDPHINPEFFKGDRLRSPSDIADTDWSIYDSQLTVFLAPFPAINDAIALFGRTFTRIAAG